MKFTVYMYEYITDLQKSVVVFMNSLHVYYRNQSLYITDLQKSVRQTFCPEVLSASLTREVCGDGHGSLDSHPSDSGPRPTVSKGEAWSVKVRSGSGTGRVKMVNGTGVS
jgi:hypothetical protein